MKKSDIIFIVFVVLLVFGIFIFSKVQNTKESKGKTGNKGSSNSNLLTGKHYVEIDVENYGKIKLELDADVAPITVTNFVNLVNDKFYDGLTFHRIIEGFMIQGGGYQKDGSKKIASSIKGEFLQNGVRNNISHKKGVISMARTPYDMDSASSEFFITQADSFHLDGSYAAFGYVIDGIDVVDKIAKKSKPTDDNGSISLDERPVIKTIRVIEK